MHANEIRNGYRGPVKTNKIKQQKLLTEQVFKVNGRRRQWNEEREEYRST